MKCPRCGGSGWVQVEMHRAGETENDHCPVCHGEGKIKTERFNEVYVDPSPI